MKNLILVVLFLCGGLLLHAQDLPEIVYLKNGNLIRGRIVKLVPDETLEIKSGDGKIYVYRMSDVERIEKNMSAPVSAVSDTNTEDESDYIEPASAPRRDNAPNRQRQTRSERDYDDDDVYNRRSYNSNRSYDSYYGESDKKGVFNFGIKAGMNVPTFEGKGAEGANENIGFNAGIFIEYTLPTNLYFISGLEFTVKGAKADYTDGSYSRYKETYNPMYLQLPIHVGYKADISDGISLGLHAGPYIAYGIAGEAKAEVTYKGKTNKGEQDFFGSASDGGAKAFDFGLGTGLDLDIHRFRIGLGYDLGLENIGRDSDYPVRNRNFYVHIGCKF